MSNDPENCPHCKVSLLADPIPKESLQHYSGTYFKREIGIEIRGFYDGVAYYECPDCGGEWGGSVCRVCIVAKTEEKIIGVS